MAVLPESQIKCPFLKDALDQAEREAFSYEGKVHYGAGYYRESELSGSAACTETECTNCIHVVYRNAPCENVPNPVKTPDPILKDLPDFVPAYCVFKSEKVIDVSGGGCVYDEM